MYTILYEKCESEAIRRAETLAKDCDGILDEVEYLKKFDKVWNDFQRHYVRKQYKTSFYFILKI